MNKALKNRYITWILLGIICLISLFANQYKQTVSPPCFNNDEAAFGYNAYSLAITGADEYGTVLPLRLKSFGDYKMPLYSYLSVPFVAFLGLSEQSAGALNTFISIVFPLVVFLLARELFDRDDIGLTAALLIATSLGLNIVGRHVHEAYLAAFLTALTAYLFIRVIKRPTLPSIIWFCISLLLLLFSYHPGRVFGVYFFLYLLFHLFIHPKVEQSPLKKQLLVFAGACVVVLALFTLTDVIYKPERVKNLLFFNNAGFSLKINELRGEGGSRFLYNKVTVGIRDVAYQYAQYFSPQFLAINGDANYRFGFPSMAPMTLVEYVCMFIGLFYLFKNKSPWRYFLVGLLLITPASASLSWADASITRALFIFVITLLISAFGLINWLQSISKVYRPLVIGSLVVVQLFFLFFAWDFYLNHYPKRARVIRSWQCGYTELGEYVKRHYQTTDKFYITKKHGEPYIMMLFALTYPPEKYHAQATLSAPDEYGFGQVERFDKFEFNFRLPQTENNYIAVGYPDDFNGAPASIRSQVKKITVGGEEIFWVYEQK